MGKVDELVERYIEYGGDEDRCAVAEDVIAQTELPVRVSHEEAAELRALEAPFGVAGEDGADAA